MKKFVKLTKALISVFTSAAMLAALPAVGYAAAEPEENVLITQKTCNDDWSVTDYRLYGRNIIDFSTIDEGDTEHGEVCQYRYISNGTMGGYALYDEALAYASPNKMLSFDFYVYDNTIPYEIRFVGTSDSAFKNTMYISQFNINYATGNITAPNENAVIGVVESGAGSNPVTESAKASVANRTWHKMDVIFTKDEVKYYLNGTYLGTSYVAADLADNTYNSFSTVQVVSRQGYQADSVDAASGLYIDNVKVYGYEDDALFYGKASIDGSDITVEFSESVSAAQNFSAVEVYNTKTGAKLSTKAPVLKNLTTLLIQANETLDEATEYLVCMPDNITGISGKKLYGEIYFTTPVGGGSTVLYNEDFGEYTTLASNNTDVMCVDEGWFSYVNIEELTDDTTHGKVLSITNKELALATDLRGGIKFGGQKLDVTQGEVSVEFDIKIPDTTFTHFYIQPYTYIDGETDSEQMRTNIANNADGGGKVSQLCTLSFSTGAQIAAAETSTNGKGWLQMVKDEARPIIARDYGTISYWKNAAKYGYKVMAPNEWHKIKLTIDGTTGDYTKVKLYADDEFVCENTASTSGAQATNNLYGIRFAVKVPEYADSTKTFLQLDNIRVTKPAPTERVEKIRIYNLDGETFGPMSTGVKASADKAKIYFTSDVDTSDAVVVLNGGGDTIECTLSAYDEQKKILSVEFDDLLKKSTDYTLSITGVKTQGGAAIPDGSAAFTTSDTGELIIDGLKLTDGAGDEVNSISDVVAGSKIYTSVKIVNTLDEDKTAAVITAVYNDTAMTDLNYKNLTLPSMTREVISNGLPVTVKSAEKLVLKSLIWEGFESNKPLKGAFVCE